MGYARSKATIISQCALTIVTANSLYPIDLTEINIFDPDDIDKLANSVVRQSVGKFTIRHADKELFRDPEALGPCLHMARVLNLRFGQHHVIRTLDNDVLLFTMRPTKNGLQLQASPRQRHPENLAEFRERLVSDVPWDKSMAAATDANTATDAIMAELERRIDQVENENRRLELRRVLKNDHMGDIYLSSVLWICGQLEIDPIEILARIHA